MMNIGEVIIITVSLNGLNLNELNLNLNLNLNELNEGFGWVCPCAPLPSQADSFPGTRRGVPERLVASLVPSQNLWS